MGRSQIKQFNAQRKNQFNDRFSQVYRQQSLQMLIQAQTGDQFTIKQIVIRSSQQQEVFLETIQKKSKLKHQNIIRLIQCYKLPGDPCSHFDKYWLLYEYSFKSIKDQIKQRLLNKQKISEAQIWTILYSCIKGMIYLQGQSIFRDLISSEQILIHRNGKIIINDPWLFSNEPSDIVIFQTAYKQYMAPELKCNKIDRQSKIQLERANVYSLGIVILECLTLRQLETVQNVVENNKNIANILNGFKQYSLNIEKIVKAMTQLDQTKRPTYQKLLKYMQNKSNYQEEGSQKQYQQKLIINTLGFGKHSILQNKYIQNVPTIDRSKNIISLLPITSLQPNHIIKNSLKNQQFNYNSHKIQPQTADLKISLLDKTNIVFNSSIIKPIKLQYKNNSPNRISAIRYLQPAQSQYESQTLFTNAEKIESVNYMTFSPLIDKKAQQIMQDREKKYKSSNSANSSKSCLKKNTVIPQVSENSYVSENMPKLTNQVIYYPSGAKYQGDIVNNMRQGYGKMVYGEGGYYIGYWRSNKMHGQGKLYYTNNELAYEGEWSEDRFNEKGKLYNQTPVKIYQPINFKNLNTIGQFWLYYEGSFKDDKKHGPGKIQFTNGQCFEGNFIRDKIEGRGRFETLDWKYIGGIWEAGLYKN